MTRTQNGTQTDFIMSPTVDVCFCGLMENPIVRKGFCAAIMRISPDMIGETELLPTHMRRENAHDKLGILDVLVKLKDGTRINMEKLPKELRTGEDIVDWMRFLNGKTREEFECMAGTSEYFGEAYEALQRLSADERKRLEYEQRDKALKDYNSQMNSARRQGQKIGEEIGENAGIRLACKVLNMYEQGKSAEEIVLACDTSVEKVQMILQNVKIVKG